jgi:hypothetical protein
MKAVVPVFIALSACQPTDPSDTDSAPEDTNLAQDTAAPKDTGEPPFGIENPLSFSEPTVILETPGNAKTPTIAALPDGSLHVMWHDFSTDPANLYHGSWDGFEWTAGPLPLHEEKSIRPQLVAHEDTLHLLFDVWEDELYTAHHASFTNGSWSDPAPIGLGEKGSISVDPNGDVHVVFYRDGEVTHSRLVAGQWAEGDPIPTPESVNPFGLWTVSTPTGISLAVGAGSCTSLICHDIMVFNWTSQGWTGSTLFKSNSLSSDEPKGAVMPDGSLAWAWAEQVPYEPYITGVAFSSALDPNPVLVFEDLSGFASEPGVAVPPDGVPMVSWLAPGAQVMIDRYPFGDPRTLLDSGTGPELTVDASGYTHVVAYAYDDAGSQQIWHTTNRVD